MIYLISRFFYQYQHIFGTSRIAEAPLKKNWIFSFSMFIVFQLPISVETRSGKFDFLVYAQDNSLNPKIYLDLVWSRGQFYLSETTRDTTMTFTPIVLCCLHPRKGNYILLTLKDHWKTWSKLAARLMVVRSFWDDLHALKCKISCLRCGERKTNFLPSHVEFLSILQFYLA